MGMHRNSREWLADGMCDAADHGDVAKLTRFLAEGADPDAKDEFGLTPLNQAATNGHAAVVKLLIDAGADTGIRHKGQTPLHLAAGNGHAEAVAALLAGGADPNARHATNGREADPRGASVLHWAASCPEHEAASECSKLLIAAGADPTATNHDGRTPAERASEAGNERLAATLSGEADKRRIPPAMAGRGR